jgi:hypothetical protein
MSHLCNLEPKFDIIFEKYLVQCFVYPSNQCDFVQLYMQLLFISLSLSFLTHVLKNLKHDTSRAITCVMCGLEV